MAEEPVLVCPVSSLPQHLGFPGNLKWIQTDSNGLKWIRTDLKGVETDLNGFEADSGRSKGGSGPAQAPFRPT